MRNHLAEQVLDADMLHALKVYRKNLGEKGTVLNGLVELIEQTSQLIHIFRDIRPIKDKSDERLRQLESIDTWFTDWESTIQQDNSMSKKEMSGCILSAQCHEDIHISIRGFISLCKMGLDVTSVITPGLINSDVIENVFCQQRSTYNGTNANPNVVQYKKTINSITVGQTTISHKSNAGKSTASVPFLVDMKAKTKRKKTINDSNKKHQSH
ncbi:hypothetical protein DPMN_046588 [Dreissena polymorpha]|uniref:Uncharacterized protein n=1 Tax=Dreissena polymorpha TaxID=45954 RepID=A0A9D4I0Q8_DREPO|nr:hypothetical protein DPMN_046588 [Dreissena polymorpha]